MSAIFLSSPRYPACSLLPYRSNWTTTATFNVCCYNPSIRRLILAPFPPNTNFIFFRNRFPRLARIAHSDNGVEGTVKYEEEEARDAVSRILLECGASEEDSVKIALGSPKYLAMLIDSVRELDELRLWDSWTRRKDNESSNNQEIGEFSLSLKEKVYYMAKKKGDKGLLPFLESLGLSLSSATRLARYLSSLTLPDLIDKVKCVKKMFFSNSDDGLIGYNARQMMMHLSISVDEDVQQTLSFFEKIEARRGGLDALGSRDASFPYFMESFPRILLLSLETHIKPFVEFFKSIGVPKQALRNILLLYPPMIFYDIEKVTRLRLQAFEKVGVSDKDLSKMLLRYPWIISARIQENYREILSFFDKEKVPEVSVHLAIKSWPLLLGCSTDKLKLMVEQFGELGVRNKNLGQVIATSPQLLLRKPQEFVQVVLFLKDLGLEDQLIGRILGRCPEIFTSSIAKTLNNKLTFLTTIGVSKSHFPRIIRKYPELFVCDVHRAMLPRMKYLMETGLSKRDIAFMVRKFSPLLGYSIQEVLRPKLEFLVNTMRKPVKDVVDYPRYFSYSLEEKIKPRYWVLKGRNLECSLQDMLAKNDEEFAAEFIDVEKKPVSSSPPPPSYS
ncbi:hypothetical protein NMG60_11033176 [Bertholletia excelsa]